MVEPIVGLFFSDFCMRFITTQSSWVMASQPTPFPNVPPPESRPKKGLLTIGCRLVKRPFPKNLKLGYILYFLSGMILPKLFREKMSSIPMTSGKKCHHPRSTRIPRAATSGNLSPVETGGFLGWMKRHENRGRFLAC